MFSAFCHTHTHSHPHTLTTHTPTPSPQGKLGKSVNMRAMNMLGKAEEKVGTNTYFAKLQAFFTKQLYNYFAVFISLFPPPPPPPLPLQYNDLLKKKGIVEKDKAKISELITELDQKKNEALKSAYERVNQVCNGCCPCTYNSATEGAMKLKFVPFCSS